MFKKNLLPTSLMIFFSFMIISLTRVMFRMELCFRVGGRESLLMKNLPIFSQISKDTLTDSNRTW